VIVYFGAISQAASIAEMASTIPIAGAQYHWTWHLAPARYKRFITWMQGWMTWFGWISLLAGIANITAIIVQQLAILNNPNYVPETWHVTMIIIAIVSTRLLKFARTVRVLLSSLGQTPPEIEASASISTFLEENADLLEPIDRGSGLDQL
jgi:hypothetical protein